MKVRRIEFHIRPWFRESTQLSRKLIIKNNQAALSESLKTDATAVSNLLPLLNPNISQLHSVQWRRR